MISDSELLALIKEGFFPGPLEDESTFIQRVVATKKLTGLSSQDAVPEKIIEDASSLTQLLFDFSGKQIPCFFQDKDLALWEGAALWIEDVDGISIPRIQLKHSFRKGSYLLYKVDEVLAHEMLHAARIAYHEPKYEEILAYQTSKNSVRRLLGPLFQDPKESYLFILLLLTGFGLEIGSVMSDFSFYVPWILLPFLWVGCLGVRLSCRIKKFNKGLLSLGSAIADHSKSLAILARLTDAEIEHISKFPSNEVRSFFNQKIHSDLRIRSLILSYFS